MAALTPMFLDFESWWSTTHSLTKMNPIAYCMHPETEIISCAIKVGDYNTDVFFGEENIRKMLNKVDWSSKLVIAHNMSGFDAMLLAWRFGIKPKMWGCTLAMARPIHAKEAGGSLKALVEHYGLGVKDNAALVSTKGKHLKDFTPDEIDAMREYNKADTEQCAGLFKRLLPLTSKDDMRLIDMTTRMLVEPQFEVDTALLEATLKAERKRKQQVLVDLATMTGAYEPGMTDADAAEAVCKTLGSAVKFGQLLRDLGIAVPTKISPTTGKEAPALAKTDEAFTALTEHDDPIVAAAASARLGVKSTMLESRITSFLEVAGYANGRMPIALLHCGADTTGRYSGTFNLNQQNLPRISNKPADALRNCLRAPHGHKVVVADLSGIELRMNHYYWKVPYSMALYDADPEKTDLYKTLAAKVFGVAYEAVTKDQRQAAKAMHLSCQFGLGSAAKYVSSAKQLTGYVVDLDDAADQIKAYRENHPEIVQGWKRCERALQNIYHGVEEYIDDWELCYTTKEGIKTPRGMIRYPNLRQEVSETTGRKQWVYGAGRHKTFIYGAKVSNNVIQHLSGWVMKDAMLAVQKQTGFRVAHTVHDEVILVVPEDEAQETLDTLQHIMRTPPSWFPALRTWSEGDIADTYGAAK